MVFKSLTRITNQLGKVPKLMVVQKVELEQNKHTHIKRTHIVTKVEFKFKRFTHITSMVKFSHTFTRTLWQGPNSHTCAQHFLLFEKHDYNLEKM